MNAITPDVRCVVLDTNIVLDLFVFKDAGVEPLAQALQSGALRWLATQAMREELERVLGYAHIASRLAPGETSGPGVLALFDRYSQLVECAAGAGPVCEDPDDQKFIELALAHGALLLSKDRAVLSLKDKLQTLGVTAAGSFP